jgi:hypothetical protein
MTENTKTATFIGIALLLLVIAIILRPKPPVAEEVVVDKVLVPDLKNATMVHGLEIVTLDDAGDAKAFKVMRESGSWRLPSKEGYPADAERHMADAATSLIDVKILSVADTRAGSHAQYGVVSPENEKADKESAGKLVKVLDRTGKAIVSLIIGKEDKKNGDGLGSDQQIRFVRKEGSDAVYKVALPSEKFSPKFSDWIETDLLKLEPWDITEVTLRDYNVFVAEDANTGRPVASLDHRGTIDLAFNDKDAKWSLKELTEYEQGKPNKVEIGEDEELNSTKLNDLKSALDDLKIVDVQRKPAGLSGTLKATDEALKDPAAARSLATHGFFPVPKENGEFEIYSQDGEVMVRMKDGLEYLLRFGKAAGLASSDEADDAQKQDEEAEKDGDAESTGTKLNRYIMVSARLNEELIPKPQLEPVPDGSADAKTDDDAKEGETKSGDAEKSSDSKLNESSDAKEVTVNKVVADEKSAETKSNDEKADDSGKREEADKDQKAEDQDGKKKPSAEEQEAQALERKRIENENQRKQKEYDDKVKKAQTKAKELNDRFADWYYVVSDETYRKIHVGRGDVIKKKPVDEKKDSEEAKDEFSIPSINDPFKKRDDAKSDEPSSEAASAEAEKGADDAETAEKPADTTKKAPAPEKTKKDAASTNQKATPKNSTNDAKTKKAPATTK